ncbi:MAG: tetratricopeptide repeat protein, partial [Winogradskyella sp.]|nr:tetratricopeptide repeat protein [Winogradskyella sp.]
STVEDFKAGATIYQKILVSIKDSNSQHYKKLSAKQNAIIAAFMEKSMKHDSAVAYSKKSIKLQEQLKNPNKFFKGLTYQRLYNQWYSLKVYDSVIATANLAKQIFTDTLGPNHTLIAEAIFDLGKVYARQGLRDKNIEYYKKAIAMNIAFSGEFTPEAAIQEHHLALTYRIVGFYKKELESFKKVVKRWEGMPDYKDMSYLGVAYGSLSTWYLEHGDVKTAETYLLKQESLIKDRKQDLKHWYNETFKGRTQTRIWYNKANLSLYNKDTIAALQYNNRVLDFIDNFDRNDPNNNPHNLSYSNNFVNLQLMRSLRLKAKMLKQSQPTEANKINQQVLKLAGINAVPTTTLGEKLNILDYYINEESLSVAQEKLDEWITIGRNRKSDYVLMNLYAKQSKIANRQDDFDQMDESYKMVFKKLQRDSLQSISIQKLKPEDCKPYGDGRILDIIIEANNNYSKAYDTTSKADYLNKMYNLSTLASSVFSNNYSYLPFNENKYEISAEINEQLLKSALLLDDDGIIDDVLQSIEQTGSKLSWKKFLASNQRENLNIPDSIIERENDLKSELHFYKKSLFTKQESNEEKLKQFKEKIYDIEIEMERLEDWYRKHYPSYFNQTQNRFDLTELKARLKDDQLVVKYVVAQGHVYAFFITKTTTDLVDLGNKETLYKKVTPFVESLSKTNSQDYRQLAK